MPFKKFKKHKNCTSYHQVVAMVINMSKKVREMLSCYHAKHKKENREILKCILTIIPFLGRQGIAIRGRCCTAGEESNDHKGELDSNFTQLLKLRSENNLILLKRIKRFYDKFMDSTRYSK